MEDSGSRGSVESGADDFVMVGGDPKLHIEGGISTSGMKEDLKEILSLDDSTGKKGVTSTTDEKKGSGEESIEEISASRETVRSKGLDNDSDQNDDSSYSNIGSDTSNTNTSDKKRIDNLEKDNFVNDSSSNDCIKDNGKETFKGVKSEAKGDDTTPLHSTDSNKPLDSTASDLQSTTSPSSILTSDHTTQPLVDHHDSSPTITIPTPPVTTKMYLMDEGAMLFTGVLYLGSVDIFAPRSEVEVNRLISLLNTQSTEPLLISLSIPSHADGVIYLVHPPSNTIISSHPIQQTLFCARGSGNDTKCFAFTFNHVLSDPSRFQCHVFRTDEPDVNVGKILYHFALAFRCTLKPSASFSSSTSPSSFACETNEIHVNMNIDIRESDGKGQFDSCPKDKDVFKLRCNVMKQVVMTLTQVAGNTKLTFKMCFGVLLSAGRNVKPNNMSLLEVTSVNVVSGAITITALFDPTLPNFQLINTPTPKDGRVFMSVAVDVVDERIREPIKFLAELKAVLLPSNHKFWYLSNRQYVEKFILVIKESEDAPSSPNAIGPQLEVVSIENQSDKERKKNRPMMSSVLSMFHNSTEPPSPQDAPECFSDNDEPLLSGSGMVSKEVTDDALLESWKDVLVKWHQNVKVKPRAVSSLAKKGVPEALRGEVWQLLVGCTDDQHMFEAYRLLIAKDSPCDDVITRDLNRTFPAHEFFQDGGGTGQESLYRICKAYSIYDTEVSYCQGVSFLTAALLLHMPEEQAFCVLVRTMYSYRLRELFRMDFEDLHLKFFQLERCIEDQMCNLYEHFLDLGLEGHMFASQWFLTLFTAKFPLFLVFSILDLFFSEGMPTIFGVALALLKMSRKELLTLDFEGVLKYFRVQLPKKYRSEEAAREMMACAVSMMPSERKLRKYEILYKAYREEQMSMEDPLERLKKDNKRLQENNLRLERENDSLARELVNSKIQLRNQLDEVEDKYECVNKELLLSRSIVLEAEEEMKLQSEEIMQLKDLCRRESQNVQNCDQRNQNIVQDYKKVCTQLTNRIESMADKNLKQTQMYKDAMEGCEGCKGKLQDLTNKEEAQEQEPASESAGLVNGDPKIEGATNKKTINAHVTDKDDVIRCLELELAQTKLALVECECRNQDLIHQLTSSFSSPNLSSLALGNGSSSNSALSNNTNVTNSKSAAAAAADGGKYGVRNSWFQKTLNSIKEATVVKASSFNA